MFKLTESIGHQHNQFSSKELSTIKHLVELSEIKKTDITDCFAKHKHILANLSEAQIAAMKTIIYELMMLTCENGKQFNQNLDQFIKEYEEQQSLLLGKNESIKEKVFSKLKLNQSIYLIYIK